MKSIQLGLSGHRFDDQYTFDLQGYITVHDFNSTMCLFNEAVRQHPPPGHKGVWCATLMSMWVLTGVSIYTMWACLLAKESPVVLLVIPVMILMTTTLWVWRYRYLQRMFQCSLFELCSRINATENIRGINYRLVRHGHHHNPGHDHAPHSRPIVRWQASYASSLVIEFDDRYRALQDPDMMSIPIFYPPPPTHQDKRFSCASNACTPCPEKQ